MLVMLHLLKRFARAVLLALAAVSLSFAPATAQTQSSAPDLSDPYALVEEYDPSPAIWELSDEDTTIYLFGTVHLLPPGFRWRSPALDAIIKDVDALVLEGTDAENTRIMTAMASKLESMQVARRPISAQLPPRLRGKWRKFVASTGQDFSTTDNAPVYFGIMGFMMSGGEELVSQYEYGVESVLEAEFAQSERPVTSIENFAQILMSLYRASDEQAVRDLATELDQWTGKGPMFPGFIPPEPEEYWAMEHAWAKGILDEDFNLGFGDGKLGKTFNRIILADRNRQWARWLDARLDEPGKILLAVGAGHFEGPDLVLAMLQERGLKAKRIH